MIEADPFPAPVVPLPHQRHGLLEIADRLVVPAQLRRDPAEIQDLPPFSGGVVHLAGDGHGLLKGGDRLVVLAQHIISTPQPIDEPLSLRRLVHAAVEGPREAGNGVGRLAAADVRVAESLEGPFSLNLGSCMCPFPLVGGQHGIGLAHGALRPYRAATKHQNYQTPAQHEPPRRVSEILRGGHSARMPRGSHGVPPHAPKRAYGAVGDDAASAPTPRGPPGLRNR
jgi:hypothetical protein